MKKLILLISGLLAFSLSPVAAEDIDLQNVLQTLENPFKVDAHLVKGTRIDDFQADFLQESHIASIDRTQKGAGAVSFRFIREGGVQDAAMFRWEYSEPSLQEIISDGRTMWFYQPENRQVIESEMSQLSRQQGENPVTFLSGLGNLSRDFAVDWADPARDGSGNPVLALRPLKESQYINQLEVTVSQQAVEEFISQRRIGSVFPILSTTVVDPGGNRTAIFFHKVRINQGLTKDKFNFQRPDGVEVVHPSEQGLGY